MSTSIPMAIDLGTTNTRVAVFLNNKVELVPNSSIASSVTFGSNGVSFGDEEPSVCGVKNLIGCSFKDLVDIDAYRFPFTVLEKDGLPMIQVEYKGETKTFHPEDITAMLLLKMKRDAEEFTGQSIDSAVITVPAYFNNAQRQATMNAATIAGLKVQRLLNESSAAAIAYGKDQSDDSKNIIVIDFGGGKTDVSVVTIEQGLVEIRATAGDSRLGGKYFDHLIASHFVQEIYTKHQKDISKDKKAMHRLTKACEAAKCQLTTSNEATIIVDSLVDGINIKETITRDKFNVLCRAPISRIQGLLPTVMESARLTQNEINEVVLVGGSSRIPAFQTMIKTFFNKQPYLLLNMDKAVVTGATLLSNYLSGALKDDFLLLDIQSYSLGLNTSSGARTQVISLNSPIPVTQSQIFSTTEDNQKAINISVYEGGRSMFKDNTLIGHYKITGLPDAPRGSVQAHVKFIINDSGILTVTAEDKYGASKFNIEATSSNPIMMSSDEIDRSIKEIQSIMV
eukprot:gene15283-18092_t